MIVKFFSTYRQIAGCKSCEMPAEHDVLALMKALERRWPEFHNILLNEDGTDKSEYVAIMVSGQYIEHAKGMETELTEDDEVAITPVVAGG